jgi:hypothetical protein
MFVIIISSLLSVLDAAFRHGIKIRLKKTYQEGGKGWAPDQSDLQLSPGWGPGQASVRTQKARPAEIPNYYMRTSGTLPIKK